MALMGLIVGSIHRVGVIEWPEHRAQGMISQFFVVEARWAQLILRT
jgi:hypothetical protein